MAKQRINPDTMSRAAAYTQVVTAEGGKLVFLAGQTPIDLQGNPVAVGDLRAQARQVYTNVGAGLAAAGATFSDVVKMTAYIVNYSEQSRGVIGEIVVGKRVHQRGEPGSLDQRQDTGQGLFEEVNLELRLRMRPHALVSHLSHEEDSDQLALALRPREFPMKPLRDSPIGRFVVDVGMVRRALHLHRTP